MNQIGRYEIIKQIGTGGMGEIYHARDTNLNREVAIKVLLSELRQNKQFMHRFQREARLVAPLEHPNIVPLYDFGLDKSIDRPYLVMRLMRGGTLEDRLNELDRNDVWRMVTQVGGALQHAHDQGVIHRDIKPSNILYDRSGNAYLSDFGIARESESATRLTGAKIIGTPVYMSPEQCTPHSDVTFKSDQYSFGILVYEALVGDAPFKGDTMALLYQHVNEPLPISELASIGVPAGVVDALERATAKDPEDRFGSVREFVAAVSQASSGQPARVGSSRQQPNAKSASQNQKGPSRLPYIIAGLVGLIGVALLLFNILGGDDDSDGISIQADATTPTEVAQVAVIPTETEPPPTETAAPTSTATPTETPSPTPTLTPEPTETEPVVADYQVEFFPAEIDDLLTLRGETYRLRDSDPGELVMISEDERSIGVRDIFGAEVQLIGSGVLGLKYDSANAAYLFSAHCLAGICDLRGDASQPWVTLEEGFVGTVDANGEIEILDTIADYDAFQTLSDQVPAPSAAVLARIPTETPTASPVPPSLTPEPAATTSVSQPQPAATAPPLFSGELGAILFTSGNSLYTADPSGSSATELGPFAVNTCQGNNPSLASGASFTVFRGSKCEIGSPNRCPSPAGGKEVIVNRANDEFTINLANIGAEDFGDFVYGGAADIDEGLIWSPTGNAYLWLVGDAIFVANANGGSGRGLYGPASNPVFSTNGSQILYLGPGNDLFVGLTNGGGSFNITNNPSLEKRCAVWVIN